jgi:photosystem II stability/assembly factor-like uncharacterized protein
VKPRAPTVALMATLWAMTVLLGCVGHPAAPPESSSTKPAAAMTPDAPLPGDRIAARTFIDQQRGWAVGTSAGNGSLIERTLDGGDTWTVQLRDDDAFPLTAVSFADSENGWTVSSSGTLAGYTPSRATSSPRAMGAGAGMGRAPATGPWNPSTSPTGCTGRSAA